MAAILETVGLTKYFGMVRAAENIRAEIHEGQLVGIVGPNGSGKTTFLNLITGYVRPTSGRIRFRGSDITGLPPRTVTALGIARSFQIPQLYTGLTVLENMLIALAIRGGRSWDFWSPLRRDGWVDEAVEILNQFGFRDERAVVTLPEGERKLLDVALSFALRPTLLLMDEPTSGVSMRDKFAVMDTLVRVLKQNRMTAVFVEHDMEIVERYAERVLAFSDGKVIADGTVTAVFADPAVKTAILGVE